MTVKSLFNQRLLNIKPSVWRVVLLATLFCGVSDAFASNEKISDVKMTQCHLDYCVSLRTERLYKSALARTYAFGPSQVKIQANDQSPILLQDFEGTFDAEVGRFYLSRSGHSFDIVIDVKERKIYRLPR